jgi:hypothetical protein
MVNASYSNPEANSRAKSANASTSITQFAEELGPTSFTAIAFA